MPYTQEDVETIKMAIATGAKKVRFADGRETEFRTLAEMRSIRDEIEAEIGLRPEPLRTTYASFTRD